MNRCVYVLPLLALAACSKPSPTENNAPLQADTTTVNDAAAPGGIAVTAAPGVAFAYHYAFSLAAAKIAGAQEAHAQACEKLGITRCRITGMRYQLRGENQVDATLLLKLDPTLARAFGKNAIAIAQSAEGTLTEAEITGSDAASTISAAESNRTRAVTDVQHVDQQLDRKGLSGNERVMLQQQRSEATARAQAAVNAAGDARDSLATTPMELVYTSDAAVPGFDGSAPVKSSLTLLVGSAQTTIGFLLGAIALLGPPGIVVLLGWLVWRRFSTKRRGPAAQETHTDPSG